VLAELSDYLDQVGEDLGPPGLLTDQELAAEERGARGEPAPQPPPLGLAAHEEEEEEDEPPPPPAAAGRKQTQPKRKAEAAPQLRPSVAAAVSEHTEPLAQPPPSASLQKGWPRVSLAALRRAYPAVDFGLLRENTAEGLDRAAFAATVLPMLRLARESTPPPPPMPPAGIEAVVLNLGGPKNSPLPLQAAGKVPPKAPAAAARRPQAAARPVNGRRLLRARAVIAQDEGGEEEEVETDGGADDMKYPDYGRGPGRRRKAAAAAQTQPPPDDEDETQPPFMFAGGGSGSSGGDGDGGGGGGGDDEDGDRAPMPATQPPPRVVGATSPSARMRNAVLDDAAGRTVTAQIAGLRGAGVALAAQGTDPLLGALAAAAAAGRPLSGGDGDGAAPLVRINIDGRGPTGRTIRWCDGDGPLLGGGGGGVEEKDDDEGLPPLARPPPVPPPAPPLAGRKRAEPVDDYLQLLEGEDDNGDVLVTSRRQPHAKCAKPGDVAGTVSPQHAPGFRRQTLRWTADEENELIRVVDELDRSGFGGESRHKSHMWKVALERGNFHAARTSVDLKDKVCGRKPFALSRARACGRSLAPPPQWRNLQKKGQVPL
jgi:hypothetical protein